MDNKNLIAYSKVHEYLLGKLPSPNTYDGRIIAQKIGYLAEDTGIYLGEMSFFWHKRGPYSRSLASALRYYEKNKDIFQEECMHVRINQFILPKLDYLKEIISYKPESCSELYWLEICASLKFLSKSMMTKDIELLSSILLKKKPFLEPFKNELYTSWKLLNTKVSI